MSNMPLVSAISQEVSGDTLPDDSIAVPKSSVNLVKIQTMFGITAQIYNWQYTGLTIQLVLPIENLHNYPLFVIRVNPITMSLYHAFKRHNAYPSVKSAHSPGCGYVWDRLRMVFQPMAVSDLRYDDTGQCSPNVKIIETDDVPDISIHTMRHMYWRGGLNFSLRSVSNMTSQGRLSLTRMFHVARPRPMCVSTMRVPMQYNFGSQLNRQTTGFDYVNLASLDDIEIACPFAADVPYRSVVQELNCACAGDGSTTKPADYYPNRIDDYICVDPIALLDKSAGAATVSYSLWIKAAPDFELSGAQPLPGWCASSKFSHLNRLESPLVLSDQATSNFIVSGIDAFGYKTKDSSVIPEPHKIRHVHQRHPKATTLSSFILPVDSG